MLHYIGAQPARLTLLLATCIAAGFAGAAVTDAHAGLECEWTGSGCAACVIDACEDLCRPEQGESCEYSGSWITWGGQCDGECEENFYWGNDVDNCGPCLWYE